MDFARSCCHQVTFTRRRSGSYRSLPPCCSVSTSVCSSASFLCSRRSFCESTTRRRRLVVSLVRRRFTETSIATERFEKSRSRDRIAISRFMFVAVRLQASEIDGIKIIKFPESPFFGNKESLEAIGAEIVLAVKRRNDHGKGKYSTANLFANICLTCRIVASADK